MIQWQGNTIEFNKNLGLLKSIDLSSNNLTVRIPYELTDLHELLALNLSNNALAGEIPHKIGEMKNLLTLDLSRNNLSGGLPSSMSQLNFINYIDMSHNNLLGRIPPGQLQTFDPSRYADNVGLCGLPVLEKCGGDDEIQKYHLWRVKMMIMRKEQMKFGDGFILVAPLVLVPDFGLCVMFYLGTAVRDMLFFTL
ncbi:hypothetical protein L1987_81969 [Smallanthus sonchifolius]|uniref:Uncharacterized protein n=1 Tax=Smallanthus sonchifolius TaxID=185202 RepID=A0ACB8YS70_9ASTR|nr:hypothetical protein L1987_81969 [Smallanthus sonchifolius]